MAKTRDTGFLVNVINVDQNGNVAIVSGSRTLLSVSSSGAVTTTGVISGSNALSASYSISGSYAVSSSYAFSASSAINSFTASNANTASSADTFIVRNNLTGSNALFTGAITAQTLVVQTVTSSILYTSGSNRFGSQITDRQTFTGSMYITGSNLIANIDNICFSGQICVGANNSLFGTSGSAGRGLRVQASSGGGAIQLINSAGGDGTISATGAATSMNYSFSTYQCSDVLFICNNGLVGINTNTPYSTLDIRGGNISVCKADSGVGTISAGLILSHYSLTHNNQTGAGIFSLRDNGDSNYHGLVLKIHNTATATDPSVVAMCITSAGNALFSCAATFYVPEATSNTTGVGIVGKICGKAVYIGANCTYSYIQSHGSVPLRINELGNDIILAAASNNVGIGCTSPGYKLDVSGVINSGDTNGLALGAVSGRRRIQYGSTAANSFTLLTDGNGYANLYANAVCAIGGTLYADTNIRVGSGTSVGNSTDPAITAGGCSKAGIYFSNGGVGMGACGQAAFLNSNGTLYNTSTTMFGSNGLWHQSVGGIRFNANSLGGGTVHIKTNIYHQNSIMIAANVRGYEYSPDAIDTDIYFYTYTGVSYVYGFGVYKKAATGWTYGAYYSTDDYVVLYVSGLGSYAGFTLNFNNTSLLQNSEICVQAWKAASTTSAQY